MNLSRNKKAVMWPVLITLLLGAIVTVLVITTLIAGKKLAFEGINMTTKFGLAGGNAPNTFLFEAKSLRISEENMVNTGNGDCSQITDPNGNIQYKCKPNTYINFSTYIYNGGASQRRFYGGIVVCEIQCDRRGKSCNLVDKSCTDRITDSLKSETCTVRIGETDICDAGKYVFKENSRYFVYPVATCELDETYGCWSTTMISPERRPNSDAGLKIITIDTIS